ncbi:MAG: tRNA (adenosine(37)-N6)-threonylcarbamoyltransferase complex dimerization subunit type 1 TsaB [Candidatus Omnitrophica bacterium]|nr:tRNA (adenosine(37)-N6)-threonylcarbamoyltransferase complex dimerization subunit type 1 TsaB [Candidatus Omnitrophota bacterium]
MKILALDTTTKILTLVVSDGSKAAEYNLEVGRKLSGLLEETIKRVTCAFGLELNAFDYFALGLGPGSFTGMRVGMACIKGLAWTLNKPIVGVSTLDILAQGVLEDGRTIIPAIDAKRKLIYCSSFTKNGGRIKRNKPYMLVTEKEFLKFAPKGCIILGDAVSLYRDSFSKIEGVKFPDKDMWFPKAHNLVTLSLERIKERKISNAFDIKPIYLYPKECQIKSI